MVNKVILIGRLGKDPEIRTFEGNNKVANFTMATTERYTDRSGNRVEQTEWHNIAAWRAQADLAEKYLKKGMLIYAEGRLKSRSWDDKEGNKRSTTEIVIDNFKMLERREEGNAPAYRNESASSSGAPESAGSGVDSAEGDLPF